MLRKSNMLKDYIAKKRIPKGTPYCYKITGTLKNALGYKVKHCPYWKVLKYLDCHDKPIYYCKYLRFADTYQGETLLWDAVKECGINE